MRVTEYCHQWSSLGPIAVMLAIKPPFCPKSVYFHSNGCILVTIFNCLYVEPFSAGPEMKGEWARLVTLCRPKLSISHFFLAPERIEGEGSTYTLVNREHI